MKRLTFLLLFSCQITFAGTPIPVIQPQDFKSYIIVRKGIKTDTIRCDSICIAGHWYSHFSGSSIFANKGLHKDGDTIKLGAYGYRNQIEIIGDTAIQIRDSSQTNPVAIVMQLKPNYARYVYINVPDSSSYKQTILGLSPNSILMTAVGLINTMDILVDSTHIYIRHNSVTKTYIDISGNIFHGSTNNADSLLPSKKVVKDLINKPTQLSGSLTDGMPTAAETTAIIGASAATKGAGYKVTIKDSDGTGLLYRVESDGSDWYCWGGLCNGTKLL